MKLFRIVLTLIAVLSIVAMSATSVLATKPDEGGGHKVGICHRTASDTNPYVYIEVDVASLSPGHLDNDDPGHKPTYWKSDGTFRGVAHVEGDAKDDYLAETEADCNDIAPTSSPTETPECGLPEGCVPTPTPTVAPTPTPTVAPTPTPAPVCIDINTASFEDLVVALQNVEGLGGFTTEEVAQSIIEGRPFGSLDDLEDRVFGLGPVNVLDFAQHLCDILAPTPTPTPEVTSTPDVTPTPTPEVTLPPTDAIDRPASTTTSSALAILTIFSLLVLVVTFLMPVKNSKP